MTSPVRVSGSVPISATLRSATCIFEVRCEVTGHWLSLAYCSGWNPVGFWLRDGRLVSPICHEGERAEAYHGTQEEILRRRSIQFILDGPDTFLPVVCFRRPGS